MKTKILIIIVIVGAVLLVAYDRYGRYGGSLPIPGINGEAVPQPPPLP